MANTYESKFKGVEVDDGVNTATYATGTGGINVTIKGTTNVTGTSGRHLEIDGSGKQDKITGGTSLNAAALSVNSLTVSSSINAGGAVNIAADTMTFEIGPNDIIFKSDWGGSVVFNNSAIFKGTPGVRFYLGDTGEYANILAPSNSTGVYDVRLPDTGGTLALTSDIPTGSGGTTISVNGKTQSTLKAAIYPGGVTGGVGDGETLALFDEQGGLNCADFSADYCYVAECTAQTSAQKNYRTTIQPTGIYFEWTGGSYPDLDEGSNKTLTLCGPLSTSTTSGNVIRLPAKSGTVALLSDITAGVSSIGGTTGAITLSTGLAMSGQQLVNKVKIYTEEVGSTKYLCIDTN